MEIWFWIVHAVDSVIYAWIAAIALALIGIAGVVNPAARQIGLVQIISAFASMNLFALLGFGEYLTNRDSHLWARAENGKSA